MNKNLFAALACLLLVPGCSTAPQVSLIPQEDGAFRTVAFAPTEQLALDGSLAVAASTCRDRQQRHVVSGIDTRFRGAWSNPRDHKDQAEQLSAYVSAPTFPSLNANDDYEVKIQFRCV
ncbi:hypothetical protein [Herbaspirillum sp. alder98]|uniref:hypothetical protein n=1 Tax=Herbaspirillum sp. alder98 TaxID=2913096 RepID=UPI001CD8942D|nr:hypothetical protein [Herbaspirillum sp. alder98]MCA1325632.1 hypothetical protein [Herbaspirillum sp. alder98]